ncbi:YkgJ family cysteine cluster protein [bacterium]|nr:YkgJ family cysteine cluster protein [bacterium]
MWIEEKGLSFSCTGCGACCTGSPGFVWLKEEDIKRLCMHLQMERDLFLQTYCRNVEGRYSLIEDDKTYDCAFLKDNKCSLYHARPKQCRTYPFWQEVIKDKDSWDKEQMHCEGINPKEKNLISKKEIERIIK